MENSVSAQPMLDHTALLQTYGVRILQNGYYLQVGEIQRTQGWILHLSVIEMQIDKLLQTVVPFLIDRNVPFKIIHNRSAARCMLEGTLGYINLGKLVSIYPETDEQANILAKELIQLTKNFRGPAIPTDRLLEGIVHTRYGSFNPVLINDANGQPVKHIYNNKGKLVPDPYDIPFLPPKAVVWPFADITPAVDTGKRKLLNYAYYPLHEIKPDAKGTVMKGLYFKKWMRIRTCLLKQGKKNMLCDEHGRDIRQRLMWQYELYQALGKDIPMPQVFDYFREDNGDDWLAMQFIKGISLTKWITGLYGDRCWRYLKTNERIKMMDKLLDILYIIEKMHELGYIHRDVTPENFLIDKRGRYFLIDMELTWNINTSQPYPPFSLGTPGHTSPEQMVTRRPTAMEDIYGIGGLMVLLFTNLYALKFNPLEQESFKEALIFFTGEQDLATCVARCQHSVPSERPGLSEIIAMMQQHREMLVKRAIKYERFRPVVSLSSLETIIKKGITGLNNLGTIDKGQPWFSVPIPKEEKIGNEQLQMMHYEGWHTGMAGPLWLSAQAKKFGFSIQSIRPVYVSSWNYIQNNSLFNPKESAPGLYKGTAGISLALAEGIAANILLADGNTIQIMQQCFFRSSDELTLASGIAGQGLGLLGCELWLDEQFVQAKLKVYLELLLACQQKNGSWDLSSNDKNKRDVPLGIDNGVAGIIWFMLCYYKKYRSNSVRAGLEKALNWLIGQSRRDRGRYIWAISSHSKHIEYYSTADGMPGIGLIFIKAYDLFGQSIYKEMAERALTILPKNPVHQNLSLGIGLAGLGDIYLEAFQVLKDEQWQERADWIVQLLIHCFKSVDKDRGHWITYISTTSTADLFTGNGGILFFLMRYLYPEKVGHHLST